MTAGLFVLDLAHIISNVKFGKPKGGERISTPSGILRKGTNFLGIDKVAGT